MPQSKSKTMPAAQKEGQHSFRISKPTINTRKRAKFDGKRREEVKAVRNRRSCLRCSLLKIKCSDDDLCTTCEQLSFVTRKHEKQTLTFCGCIRTRLSEVSVFEVYIAASRPRRIGNEKSIAPTLANISLEFGSQVTWDLGALVDDIVDWLNNPQLSETSKVGTLSSPRFLELVSESSGPKAGSLFQQMIYAISSAYTRNDGSFLIAEELHQFGSIAGHDFLTYLDEKLKPMSLARCSHSEMRALFLWVFGTILAVGYAQPSSNTHMQERTSAFKSLQNHLCQILAHYLIFLGSQLGLPIKTGTDQFLLEAAPTRWYREGQFVWKSPNRGCSFLSASNSIYYSQHDSSSKLWMEDATSNFHEDGDQEPNFEEILALITSCEDSHSQGRLLERELCGFDPKGLCIQESGAYSPTYHHSLDLGEGIASHQEYSTPGGRDEISTWPFQQSGVQANGSMLHGNSATAELFSPGNHGGTNTSQSATNMHKGCHSVSSLYLPRPRHSEAQSPGGEPTISENYHVLDSEYLWDGCIECGGSLSSSSSCDAYPYRSEDEEFEEESNAETQFLLV
ncbi:hypothetical protein DL95DRAFT_462229 [Leptodontidium sp. 2 PMI_412]|nr:hypothetical protein DL95DRAFT_462229 [Leptodontidium sp. 2 PMI_412]